MNKYKYNIKRIGKLIILLGVILLLISTCMINIKNKGITAKTAVQTEATIIDTSNIYGGIEVSRRSILYVYNINITYHYKDDYGNNYTTTEICRSINFDKIAKKYLQGETILITYNKNNPEISILGKINSYIFPHEFSYIIFHLMSFGMLCTGIYFCIQKKYKYFNFSSPYIFNNSDLEFATKLYTYIFLIFIIILFFYFKQYLISLISIFILLFLQFTNYRKNKIEKELTLEVVTIEYIDYEREKVTFKDDTGTIYQYYTDFGEEFKYSEKYNLIIKLKNLKKEKINNNTHSQIYNIINTEKNKFMVL